ncbi:transcription factor CP2-like protein 1 [Talpa occidentalis]|uniref:transcription factor CP2-like protein 1 n=1 Tax=Talpa occidentalis TaxID=50954 RepID=UPI0023F9FC4F|nr:transcription factor CP2-like protein 1 [Talpa occidentalis]
MLFWHNQPEHLWASPAELCPGPPSSLLRESLPLPYLKQEELPTVPSTEPPYPSFQYVLCAATSPAVRQQEESLTYLNQGQSYEVRMLCNLKLGNATQCPQLLKSVARVVFHDRRLQCMEQLQLDGWRWNRPGDRILDIDVPLSIGVLNPQVLPSQLNTVEFHWDPTKRTSLFLQVHCISTEFTPRKKGGEKGVPFRLQIDTFKPSDKEPPAERLHSAGCLIKVFKPKGADRKLKTDRERIEKQPQHERDKYQMACESTVFVEVCVPGQWGRREGREKMLIVQMGKLRPQGCDTPEHHHSPQFPAGTNGTDFRDLSLPGPLPRPASAAATSFLPSARSTPFLLLLYTPASSFTLLLCLCDLVYSSPGLVQDGRWRWPPLPSKSRLTRWPCHVFPQCSPWPEPSAGSQPSLSPGALTLPFSCKLQSPERAGLIGVTLTLPNPRLCSSPPFTLDTLGGSAAEDLNPGASILETQQWLYRHRFSSYCRILANFAGTDLLKLTRQDLIQICGAADGIRLFNTLRVRPIQHRLTLYVAQEVSGQAKSDSGFYQEISLDELSAGELMGKLAELLALPANQIHRLFHQGPGGILILLTDQVVHNLKDESYFVVVVKKGRGFRRGLASPHKDRRMLILSPKGDQKVP